MLTFLRCEFAFKCRHMEASLNGGCVADNVTQIMALGGVGVGKPGANDGPQSLPRRESAQHDLLSTSQELEAQGEVSIYDTWRSKQTVPGPLTTCVC